MQQSWVRVGHLAARQSGKISHTYKSCFGGLSLNCRNCVCSIKRSSARACGWLHPASPSWFSTPATRCQSWTIRPGPSQRRCRKVLEKQHDVQSSHRPGAAHAAKRVWQKLAPSAAFSSGWKAMRKNTSPARWTESTKTQHLAALILHRDVELGEQRASSNASDPPQVDVADPKKVQCLCKL